MAGSERMLRDAEGAPEPPHDRPYLVISLEERHLWYKKRGEILFSTEVATGSGKTMVKEGGASAWKFETPRGRLVVQSKEEAPVWAPPVALRGAVAQSVGLGWSASRSVSRWPLPTDRSSRWRGTTSCGRFPTDGRVAAADRGGVDGEVLVPPLGTTQRRYEGVLGTHRLNMGNGYAMHGTNQPQTVGRAVSHGCVRLRNEDIAKLYAMVPVGTPVYIY